MAQVTRPETATLTLSSGETLIVKKRLNSGERREMFRMMRGPDGQTDGLIYGQAEVLAYLLDWTVKDDATNQPLVIRDAKTGQRLPNAEVAAILDSLDPEDVKEIERLVDKHDDAMIAERKEEKKLQSGSKPSGPGSPSVAAGPASATTTSTN